MLLNDSVSSSSGNCIACRTTLLLDPSCVSTLRFLATGYCLQCLGRHLQEKKVVIDPGSTNAFSRVHDCTAEMVLLTMIPSGKNRALVGMIATTSFVRWDTSCNVVADICG